MNKRRMRCVCHLEDSSAASALLARAWRQGLLPDEIAPPSVIATSMLRLHLGSRCTLRYSLADGRTWIAKHYAQPRPWLVSLYTMLARPRVLMHSAVSAPRVIAYLPHACVLLQQPARGTSLKDLLRQDRTEAASMVGGGVAALARAPLSLPTGYALRHPLARARRWVRHLSLAAPGLADAAATLFAALSDACPAWPIAPRVIHGDLSAAHVFVGERSVELVDWDDARPGDPAEDAGRLLASLVHLGVRRTVAPEVVARASAAFISSYAEQASEVAPRVPFYRALACLCKASRLIVRRDPQRQAHSAALLVAGLEGLR